MYKRILSIDGGGIKGVFPASFLSSVEEEINGNINEYFDLIVGTSTGGIIALGLGMGLSTKEILEFYKEYGPRIFYGDSTLTKKIRHLFYSKYDRKNLEDALESTFGERRLGESTNRLVIPSLDINTGEVYVYKTAHNARFEKDYKKLVTEVALATSAAPTYFPTFMTRSGVPLVDGGIWANNPTGFSVVESIGVLGWPKDSLKVLSIGCTSEPCDMERGMGKALGIGYWGRKITDLFMRGQSSSSMGTAILLAGKENVIRINPTVRINKYKLDRVKEIKSLEGLGETTARNELPNLRETFFSNKVEPFTPEYQLNN